MKEYYIYIITNKYNSVFYIGVTNNLKRRIYEHVNKLIEGFSNKYNLTKLIYFENYNNIDLAIRREKQLKNWHRDWKLNLVKTVKPNLKELLT